jgi:hypothetical protein
VIVLDVNVLAYLQSFELLAKLGDVFRLAGGGHVSWQVYMQVKRSGTLGDRLDQWIDEKLVRMHNFKTSDPEGRTVRRILRSKKAGLVRKDVADIQCAALARTLRETHPTSVLTCERGLHKLCKTLNVGWVDLFDVLSLMFCEGITEAAVLEQILQPWSRADAGNGRPPDFAGSFAGTFAARYSGDGCKRVTNLFALEKPCP